MVHRHVDAVRRHECPPVSGEAAPIALQEDSVGLPDRSWSGTRQCRSDREATDSAIEKENVRQPFPFILHGLLEEIGKRIGSLQTAWPGSPAQAAKVAALTSKFRATYGPVPLAIRFGTLVKPIVYGSAVRRSTWIKAQAVIVIT